MAFSVNDGSLQAIKLIKRYSVLKMQLDNNDPDIVLDYRDAIRRFVSALIKKRDLSDDDIELLFLVYTDCSDFFSDEEKSAIMNRIYFDFDDLIQKTAESAAILEQGLSIS